MAVYGSKYSVKISPLNSRRKPSGIEEEPVETSEPYKKCVGHTFHRIPLDLETLAGGDRLIKDKSLLQKLNSPQRRLLEKAQNLLFNSRFQFPGSTPPGFSGNLPGSLSSGAPGSSSVGFPGSVPGGPGGVPPNPKALKDLFGKDKHLFTPLVADILELDHQSFRDLYGAESFCEDQADTKTINAYQASILSGIQNRFLPDLSAAYTNYSKSRASTLGDRSVEEDQADTKTISAHQASIASRLLNQFLPDPDRTHSDFNSSRASTLYEPTVEQLHEPDPNCETELYHKHCVPDWPPQVFEKSLSVASKSKTGSVYSKSKTGSVAKSDAKSATKSKSSLSNKSKSSTNTIVAPNVTVHDCLDSDTEPNQPEPVVPSGNEGTGSASESAFGTGDSSTAGGDQSDFDLDLNPNPYQEYQPPGRPLRGFGACSGCGRFACRGCCLPPPPCCPCAGPAPFPTRRNIYCFPPPPPSEFGFAEMPPKKSNTPSRGRSSAPRGPGRGSGRGRGRGRGSAGPNQSQGAPPSIIETPPEDVMGDPEADDQQEEGEEEERGDRGDPQGQMVPANQGRGQDGDQGQEKGQGQGQGQMQPCNCPLASCCRPVEPPPRIGERFFASHDLNDLWHYISHYTPASTCRSGTTCCSSSPPRSICGPVSNPCCDTQCVPKMMVQERTQLVYDQIQNVKSIIHNIRQNVLENNCSSIGSSCAPSHAGSCCPCPGGAGCCPCPGGGGGGCCGNSCRTPGGTITCYDQTGIHAMSTDRDSFTTIGDSDRFKCNYPCGTLPCDCKTNCWRPQTVYCPPQNPGFYPSAGSFCYPSCYQSRYINLPPPCCDAGEGCMCPAASKGDQKRGNSGAGPTVMFGNSNPFGPQKSSSVSLSPDESVPVDDDSMAGDDNRGPSPDHAGGSLSPGGTKRGRGRGTRGGGRGRGSMKTPSVRGRISIRGSFQSRNPAFAPNATRPTKISERYSHPMGEQAHDDDFYGSYEFNSRDGDGPGNEGGNQRGRGSGRGSGFDYPPARVSTRGQGRMTTDYQRGVFSSRPQGQSNAPPPNGFLASRDPYASVQNNAENLGFDPEFEDGPEPERPQSASPGPGQKFSSNAGATPRFTTPPARGVGSRGTRGARGRGPGRGIPGSPASRFSSPGARGSSRPGSQQGQSRGVPGGNMAAGSMVRGSMARGGNMSGGNMSGRGMSRGGTMARGGSMNRGGSTSRGGSVAGGSVAGGSVAGGSMAGGSMVDESMGRGSKIEGNRSPFGQPGGSQMHGSVFEEDPAADDFQGGPGGSESFGGGPGRGRYGGGSTRGSMRGGSVRGSLMGSRVSASRGSVGGPGRGGSVAAGRGSMAGESPMGSMAYNSGGSRMSGYQDGPQSDPRISGFSGSGYQFRPSSFVSDVPENPEENEPMESQGGENPSTRGGSTFKASRGVSLRPSRGGSQVSNLRGGSASAPNVSWSRSTSEPPYEMQNRAFSYQPDFSERGSTGTGEEGSVVDRLSANKNSSQPQRGSGSRVTGGSSFAKSGSATRSLSPSGSVGRGRGSMGGSVGRGRGGSSFSNFTRPTSGQGSMMRQSQTPASSRNQTPIRPSSASRPNSTTRPSSQGSQDEEGEGESSMGYRPYLNKQYKQYNVQYEHPHFDPSGDRYFNEDLALPLDDLASYGAEGDVVTILPKDSQIDAKLVDNMRFPSKTKKGLKKMWAKRRNELMVKSLNIDCGPLGGKPTRTSELRASYIAAKEYVPMSPGVDTSVKAYRGPIDYNTSFTRMRKYIASEKPNKSTESASPENPRVKRNSNSILKKGQARKKTKTKKVRSNIAAANVNLGFVAKGRKVMDSFHRILKNPASIPSRDSVQPKMRSVRFDSATCETFSNMLSVPTQYPNLDAIEKAREIAARHNLSKATAEVKLGVMSPIKSHRSSTARSHQTDSSDSELIVTEFREVMEIKPQLEKPKLCSLPEVLPHKASEKSNVFAQGDF